MRPLCVLENYGSYRSLLQVLGRKPTYRGSHEWREDGRIETSVDVAPEDRRGDIESASDFALRQTVDVLGDVVCK